MGRILALVIYVGPVSLFFGLPQADRKLRYLLPKNAKLHFCFSAKMFLGAQSVAVKQLNARNFRLLGHIVEFLVDVAPLVHFCLRKRQRRRSLKTKRYTTQPAFQPIAVSRCCLSVPPDRFRLRVILLKLSSMLRQFLFAPTQLHAALLSCNSTSLSIHCWLPKLIPQPKNEN